MVQSNQGPLWLIQGNKATPSFPGAHHPFTSRVCARQPQVDLCSSGSPKMNIRPGPLYAPDTNATQPGFTSSWLSESSKVNDPEKTLTPCLLIHSYKQPMRFDQAVPLEHVSVHDSAFPLRRAASLVREGRQQPPNMSLGSQGSDAFPQPK